MSHNLNFNSKAGRHSFVSAKEMPWHGLGKIVAGRMTSRECIQEALLDYTVVKAPVFVKYETPITVDNKPTRGTVVPDKFATYREDTGIAFNVVGSNYEVIQNVEAFEFFDNIVGENRAIYETAGALGNGEIVFITAKLPDHILIGGKDTINQYILLTMSHDGSSSIIAKFTPVRVVCNNTLSAALSSGSNVFKIKHTKSAKARMEEAAKLLNITYKAGAETQELYEHLTKIPFDDNQREKYFYDLFLTKEELEAVAKGYNPIKHKGIISTVKTNQLIKLFEYAESGPGQNLFKGTAYNAYNAISGYYQNVKSYKDDEKKFQGLMLGTEANLLEKSLTQILSY